MFILKSIFASLNRIRLSDAELLRYHVNDKAVKKLACPHCHRKGSLKIISHYDRYCIHVHKGKRVEDIVSVPLVTCSCEHFNDSSSAVLTDILIPFGSYSIRFVLTVLLQYYRHSRTVRNLCEQLGIAVSTLYVWKKLFEAHGQKWLNMCRHILKSDLELISRGLSVFPAVSISRIRSFPAFPESFHSLSETCFLQFSSRTSIMISAPALN